MAVRNIQEQQSLITEETINPKSKQNGAKGWILKEWCSAHKGACTDKPNRDRKPHNIQSPKQKSRLNNKYSSKTPQNLWARKTFDTRGMLCKSYRFDPGEKKAGCSPNTHTVYQWLKPRCSPHLQVSLGHKNCAKAAIPNFFIFCFQGSRLSWNFLKQPWVAVFQISKELSKIFFGHCLLFHSLQSCMWPFLV